MIYNTCRWYNGSWMIPSFFTILVDCHTITADHTKRKRDNNLMQKSISTNLPLHMIRLSCILAPKPKWHATKAKGQDGQNMTPLDIFCICNNMHLIPPLVPWLYFISVASWSSAIYWERQKGTFNKHTLRIGAVWRRFLYCMHIVDNLLSLGKLWGSFAWILVYQRYHELFMHCLLSFRAYKTSIKNRRCYVQSASIIFCKNIRNIHVSKLSWVVQEGDGAIANKQKGLVDRERVD